MLISLTGHLLPNIPPPSVYFNLHIVLVVSQRHSFRKPHLTVLFNLFFNLRKIALQCCDGFCHTTTQISHNYTYITSLLSLLLLPPLPLLQVITEHLAGLPVLYSNFSPATYLIHGNSQHRDRTQPFCIAGRFFTA